MTSRPPKLVIQHFCAVIRLWPGASRLAGRLFHVSARAVVLSLAPCRRRGWRSGTHIRLAAALSLSSIAQAISRGCVARTATGLSRGCCPRAMCVARTFCGLLASCHGPRHESVSRDRWFCRFLTKPLARSRDGNTTMLTLAAVMWSTCRAEMSCSRRRCSSKVATHLPADCSFASAFRQSQTTAEAGLGHEAEHRCA